MSNIPALVALIYVMGAIIAAVTVIYAAATHNRNKGGVGERDRVQVIEELISGCVALMIVATALHVIVNLGAI